MLLIWKMITYTTQKGTKESFANEKACYFLWNTGQQYSHSYQGFRYSSGHTDMLTYGYKILSI